MSILFQYELMYVYFILFNLSFSYILHECMNNNRINKIIIIIIIIIIMIIITMIILIIIIMIIIIMTITNTKISTTITIMK